jgi:hypothetical protein
MLYYSCRLAYKQSEHDAAKAVKHTARSRLTTTTNIALCEARCRKEIDADGNAIVSVMQAQSSDCSLEKADLHHVNSGVRVKAEELIVRGLAPAAVVARLRSIDIDPSGQQLKDAGGHHIHSKMVANWARGHIKLGVDQRPVGHDETPSEQATKASNFLASQDGWWHDYFECEREKQKPGEAKQYSRGLVFADDHRLRKLRQYGYLIILDSTHKTNYLGWYLYTIMVRDSNACWCPTVHLLTDGEDAGVLSRAIRIIKEWCKGLKGT